MPVCSPSHFSIMHASHSSRPQQEAAVVCSPGCRVVHQRPWDRTSCSRLLAILPHILNISLFSLQLSNPKTQFHTQCIKKPTNKKKTIMRIHNKTKFTSQQSKFMFIRLQETAYNYLFSKQCCCCFFFKQISMLFVLCLIFRNFMFMAVY